ncbi:MAG: hypothetical protein NZM38_02725 [Cytophagales bacterium]|nr:hypothetical protein [Cytophagales bacterium]MDW8383668.1 hypothetical protein [Flammeovirgaceae bacterium]
MFKWKHFALLFLTSFSTKGQPLELEGLISFSDSVLKVEVVHEWNSKNFFVVTSSQENRLDWKFFHYAPSGTLLHQVHLRRPEAEQILHTKAYQNFLFVLSSNSEKQYTIRIWQVESDIIEHRYENNLRLSLDFFEILSDEIFLLAGEIRGRPAAILFLPTQQPDVRVLPMINQIEGKIIETYSNPQEGLIGIGMKGNGGQARFKSFYFRFRNDASLISQHVFQESYQFTIHSFKTALLEEKQTWLVAHYGIDRSGNTQGICLIDLQKEKVPTFYPCDFSEWKLAFAHYSPKAIEKLQAKIEKFQKKGKTYPIGGRFLLHTPRLLDTVIYVSGEFYEFARGNVTGYRYTPYPARTQLNLTYWDGNPLYAPLPPTQYQPDIYRYQQFLIAAFNTSGKKIWDNQLLLKEDVSLELKPHTTAVFKNDSLCIFQKTEKEIRYVFTHINTFQPAHQIMSLEDLQTSKNEKLTTLYLQSHHQNQRLIGVFQSKEKKRKWLIAVWR